MEEPKVPKPKPIIAAKTSVELLCLVEIHQKRRTTSTRIKNRTRIHMLQPCWTVLYYDSSNLHKMLERWSGPDTPCLGMILPKTPCGLGFYYWRDIRPVETLNERSSKRRQKHFKKITCIPSFQPPLIVPNAGLMCSGNCLKYLPLSATRLNTIVVDMLAPAGY